MKAVRTFSVVPILPEKLAGLRELALDLRWSWDPATIELFRRLDTDLWEESGHNPARMLGTIDQPRLEAASIDDGFLAHLESVTKAHDTYKSCQTTWWDRALNHGYEKPLVAYFSLEFGITECLSIFAGGLGVLAGDHLKSSSDLGIPLVGVGLLYQQGYVRQVLNESGWQTESFESHDFYNLPLAPERQPDGTPLIISVRFPNRLVHAQVWRVQVGRVRLYLLDTNIQENESADRAITDQLYGGDGETRLRQELLLGIGGHEALLALGLHPTVFHMNEGHAALLGLERIRWLMKTYGLTFAEAREPASSSLVFTTHTPVPAGHDVFSPELMERYFAEYCQDVNITFPQLLKLGRPEHCAESEPFCMTILALKLAAYTNGVSRLHGQVTRSMWQGIWPGLTLDEVPIGHVTNGVHVRSWISLEMDQLYDRYLGPRWREEPGDPRVWSRIENVPQEELWRTHERRRERLVVNARKRLRARLERVGASYQEIELANQVLDSKALTIGFARRFATYKRATLILRDPDRLDRILNNPDRPVQIIFAGLAHPRDDTGKELIRQIVAMGQDERFKRKLVFIEDYDTSIARYMVQGCDVWLNTPRRPLEASGTSGMKAAANGLLNLSTLDGWWDEAWHDYQDEARPIGWAIGKGDDWRDPNQQDQMDASALYDILEHDLAPCFYERGADGLPRRWVSRMKSSIGTLCAYFNTHRMVREYAERFYVPAAARYEQLLSDGGSKAKDLAAWRKRVEDMWGQVRIVSLDGVARQPIAGGVPLKPRARIFLGGLSPEDVTVEVYLGKVGTNGELLEARAEPMHLVGTDGDSTHVFEAEVYPISRSGLHGYTVRALPYHPDLANPYLPGLIVWAKE